MPMLAALRPSYGPPESIRVEDVETPSPKSGEVLVRVRAATVNRTDCANLTGKPFVMKVVLGFPRPRSPFVGTDFAGEIAAVGPGVTTFGVGDRVFGFNDTGLGSHAQFIVRPADDGVARIPDGVTFAQAAASVEGAHYARNALRVVGLEAGARVLVNGATGAIGSAAVQLLVHAGAHVTATCPAGLEPTVLGLGAEHALDYASEDVTRGPARYDLVFDAVGKRTVGAFRPVLKRSGVYVSSELGPSGENIFRALLSPVLPGPRVRFPIPTDVPETLRQVRGLLDTGAFRPLIDRSYPLSEVADAYSYVASGKKVGNVILDLG